MNYPFFFSRAYHRISKRHVPEPIDPNLWPKKWRETSYKTYPHALKIELPDVSPPTADLFPLLRDRRSVREYDNSKSLSLDTLSLLLKFSCGINRYDKGYNLALGRKRHFRVAPSAGARFPVEIYPVILRPSPSLQSGIYHYNVLQHSLDVVGLHDFSDRFLRGILYYDWPLSVPLLIFMTAIFSRSQDKYGERGYRYVLLEAGHISQNFYLVSSGLNLGCCILTGVNDVKVEHVLGVDGRQESYIISLGIGFKDELS